MLSVNDYNYLKLLYDKFYKSNRHIKNLIELDDWDSVDIAIQEKEGIIRQILAFEKPRAELIKENSELMKIKRNLIELEKENIALVKSLKEQTEINCTKAKKAKKVFQVYEPSIQNIVSTIDIKDE